MQSKLKPCLPFGARMFLIVGLAGLCLALTGLYPAAAPARAAADLPVYTDALASAWQNWSWGAAIDLGRASTGRNRSNAIAVTLNATQWGGLYLATETALNSGDYTGVSFWIHGGQTGGQPLSFKVIDGDNGNWDPAVSITPSANTWTQVTVDFAQVNHPASLSGLVWQDATGGAQPVFYLDDIVLLGYTGPTRTPTDTPAPMAGPALSVDVSASRHAISPYIYGMNWAEAGLAEELRLPVNRWGGNATTRYNWNFNISNAGSDWYFENTPYDNADDFVAQNKRTGSATLLTLPLIGWVAKDSPTSHPFDCGFKISRYGQQADADWSWDADCGNGVSTGGANLTGNDPRDTSLATTPNFVTTWVNHLVSQHGPAANGGVQFYNLDNEPMLWDSTHRDVHPAGVTYAELRDQTYAYAAALKAADPGALTLGPVEWGWCAYFYSSADGGCETGPDRLAHGDLPWVVWYLQQMQAYEQKHGVRLLDYFDLHAYPYANGVGLSDAGNAATQALRLRSTRSLWDPTYIDESWVGESTGEAVYTIRRMQQWVAENYPGTKTAITEYNWGGLEHINGALAQADVLGIFGREGLDLATLWGPPDPAEPGAYAFRLYLNYDGKHSTFGDTSVQAASTDQSQLAVYAAQHTDTGALTLLVINKTGQVYNSTLTLANFTPAAAAQVYRYSSADLKTIVPLADQAVGPTGFTAQFPANSLTLFVIPSRTGSTAATPPPGVFGRPKHRSR